MRILDRVVAGVFAAVVAALAVVAVLEIVYVAVGDGPYFVVDWPVAVDALARNSWSDTGPLVFGGVVAALGLVLCVVALRPGRFARLPAQPLGVRTDADGATTTFVRRRNLARTLRRAAESVDGVTTARVRVGRRRVTTRVSLRPRTSDTAVEQVGDVVGQALASVDFMRPPPLTVRAKHRARRGDAGRHGDDGLVVEPATGSGTESETTTSTGGTGTTRTTRDQDQDPQPGTSAGTVLDLDVVDPVDRAAPARRERRRRPYAARVERLDRVLLTLLGLLLVGGGAVVLLAGFGGLGTETENAAVLPDSYRSFAADHGWFWPVVGIGSGLVAAAALAWLLAQFSTGRLRRVAVTEDAFGSAYVEGSGFARAVADDASRDVGVRQARATLLGTSSDPLVRLVLTTEPDADVTTTRRFTETAVLGRARRALDRPDLRSQVELEPTTAPGRRAR